MLEDTVIFAPIQKDKESPELLTKLLMSCKNPLATTTREFSENGLERTMTNNQIGWSNRESETPITS